MRALAVWMRFSRPALRRADLLRRIYHIERRTCPNCGPGRLEPIATELDPDPIAGIPAAIDRFARAAGLKRSASPSRPPPTHAKTTLDRCSLNFIRRAGLEDRQNGAGE
jgi:hypothetical protein